MRAWRSPVRKVALSSLYPHISPGGAAGHALESDAALIFLLFVTNSSRHHCLIECSWFLAIFPLFLPPPIISTQINLPTLAEGVEYTASSPCSYQYLHGDKPTNKGWMRAKGLALTMLISHVWGVSNLYGVIHKNSAHLGRSEHKMGTITAVPQEHVTD